MSVPVQLPIFGVTVIVATTGEVLLFVAGKEVMLPVPLPASPMDGVLFVHVSSAPRLIKDTVPPLHTVWLDTVTVGVGVTVIVNCFCIPVQLPIFGVTVIVAVTGEVLLFVAVKEVMLPVPED
jgi:hypothetical protein